HGFDVRLVDGPGEDIDFAEAVRRGREHAPGLVVVATTTPSIHNDIRAAEALKEATGACTVLVGTHTSALPLETLAAAPRVDAVSRKEYDWTLLELAERLAGGARDAAGVRG